MLGSLLLSILLIFTESFDKGQSLSFSMKELSDVTM
jgi:hypothetical protein